MKKSNLRNFYHTQISAQKLYFIGDALLKLGLSREQVFGELAHRLAKEEKSAAMISGEELINVYKNICALDTPNIGLQLGAQISCGCYGLYGCVLLSKKTLDDALKFSISYHSLVTRTTRLYLQSINETNTLYGCEDILEQPELKRFNLEFQIATNLTLIRESLDDSNLSPKTIYFEFSEPGDSALYSKMFNCPLIFDHHFTGIELTAEQVQLCLSKQNDLAVPLLMKTCDEELHNILSANSVLQQIYEWVCQHIHGDLSLNQLSEQMCMTPRTLRRRLAEYDTSFNEVCAEVKCRFAKNYLVKTKLSIDDIAASLGFKDPANFRRAFKGWTNLTPTQFRSSVKQDVLCSKQTH